MKKAIAIISFILTVIIPEPAGSVPESQPHQVMLNKTIQSMITVLISMILLSMSVTILKAQKVIEMINHK